MCHVWKDGVRETMSVEQLRDYLRSPFFADVKHVGITGGEPTLRKDLIELYRLLPECLPALTGASFISHGMQTAKAVGFYTAVHAHYRERNLEFSGMISLDGVGEVHDRIRGRAGAFEAATATLLQLKQAGVNVIAACTIVRSNVYGLHDVLQWGRDHGVYVRFRVAEFIRRLYNESCADEIRAFTERELRHLVCFYHLLLTEYEKGEDIRRTYASVIELLTGGERLIDCPYRRGAAVNVNSRGELASCAPKGESFAFDPDEAAVSARLQAGRDDVQARHCGTCIHDYHDQWQAGEQRRRDFADKMQRDFYGQPSDALTTGERDAGIWNPAALRRILLVGWYGTETAGDIAILRGIIDEYSAGNPEIRFGVLSLYPAYTRTTIASWPESVRQRLQIADYQSEEAYHASATYDAIVMAGGPLMDIPETRKILVLFKSFADRNKPAVIEGCGVGPLNQADLRWNVCRIARLATRIAVRDNASRDLLRLYGIAKPIEVRADPAAGFLRGLGLRHTGSDQGVIRCFLRELTSEYPQAVSSEEATERLARLLTRVLTWYPDKKVELWAMHHFPVGMDDRLFARRLQQKVNNARLQVQWEPSTPEEVYAAMAAAELCICMRFHSCVFAAEVGAPFLAIDYTAGGKIRGFLEDNGQEARLCTLDMLDSLDHEAFRQRVWPPPARPAAQSASGQPRVVHVIQTLSGGGAARALLALARHSRRLGGPEHAVVSLASSDARGLALAAQAEVEVLDAPSPRQLHRALAAADIVLVHWWNCPELAVFFRRELPPMRLATWVHVGGYHPPYLLTRELVDFVDCAIACSPHTFAHPAFQQSASADPKRATMILAGAEFERLGTLVPKPHAGFRVGYIGTLDPTKMHPDYVAMSCAVRVPEVRFVVCGGGDTAWLETDIAARGRKDSFEFPGSVEDIKAVLETLDVYGYPLCADTYAAAELNIQEAMYAGLPVVAFPHGGLASLIQHGETGLLVNTAEEYAQAIEHLHAHPDARRRLGANAARYAREHFGAEQTGRDFNRQFAALLSQPKRTRSWPVAGAGVPEGIPEALAINPGARLFVDSIGPAGEAFRDSLTAEPIQKRLEADHLITQQSRLTHYTYAYYYRQMFPRDPLLNFWAGIGFFARNNLGEARNALQQALDGGFGQWRIHWYRAMVAEQLGDLNAAMSAVQQLLIAVPGLSAGLEMQQRIAGAISEKRRVAARAAADVQQHIRKAQDLLQARKYAEASHALEAAAKLAPHQLQILELLGELYCRLGKDGAAQTVVDRILAREPARQSPRLAAIRQHLSAAPSQTGRAKVRPAASAALAG